MLIKWGGMDVDDEIILLTNHIHTMRCNTLKEFDFIYTKYETLGTAAGCRATKRMSVRPKRNEEKLCCVYNNLCGLKRSACSFFLLCTLRI